MTRRPAQSGATTHDRGPPIFNRLRAAKAYTDFTGHLPDSVQYAQLDDDPVAGYRLGRAEGVAYEATRDGKKERYFHEFSKRSRPDLVVKDDGSQLYITGGRYKVGPRGIEDMPPLMIVNPSPRPSLRRNKKGHFMARARSTVRRRARGAVRKMKVWTRNPAPRVHRRRRRRATVRSYARNPAPIRRHRRRHVARRSYRRNPIAGAGNLRFVQMIGPAAGIAAGAVGVEIAMGYMTFLPPSLMTGPVRYLTKGVISLGAGYAIAKFANRKVGEAFALGGLIIAFHDALKAAILKYMPTTQFGAYVRPGMSYYSPGNQVPVRAMNRMGGYLPPVAGSPGGPNTFGAYVNPGFAGRASDGGPSPSFPC